MFMKVHDLWQKKNYKLKWYIHTVPSNDVCIFKTRFTSLSEKFLPICNLTNFFDLLWFGSSCFDTITIIFHVICISFSLLPSYLTSFLFILFLFLFLLFRKKQIAFSIVFFNSPEKILAKLKPKLFHSFVCYHI